MDYIYVQRFSVPQWLASLASNSLAFTSSLWVLTPLMTVLRASYNMILAVEPGQKSATLTFQSIYLMKG